VVVVVVADATVEVVVALFAWPVVVVDEPG